jgi:hypothetical protein
VTVTRYVTPLREGGSLPALVEADNLGTYVMKFRGAGQGPLALVAEIIAGELARRLGLRTPELVVAELDPRIPGSEPDPEIQDLLRASEGLNLGVDFLPSSVGFDPLGWTAEPGFASQLLWFDALVHNVDRTWRNPNLLIWHRNIWLIDHGAALYFQAGNRPTAGPRHRTSRGPFGARPPDHRAPAPAGDRPGPARMVRRPRRCRLRRAPAAPRPDRARGDSAVSDPGGTEVFEYALVRAVPRVERGEPINVGVIVYSQRYRYLAVRIGLDPARLLAIDPAADLDAVRSALSAFEKGCTEGPLADRPLGERFRWLTAPRSTIVQPGPVHSGLTSGLTSDPAAELSHLFDTLVRTTRRPFP